MDSATAKAENLRRQIKEAEQALQDLRRQLQDLEAAPNFETESDEASRSLTNADGLEPHLNSDKPSAIVEQEPSAWPWPLAEDEYARYGRQLILPTVGIAGQLRLKASSVLVVGAGGLGCPAAAYLAGAGVGTLGIVDGDTVEASNLHRQIAHSTARVGQPKVHSLATFCRELNPLVNYRPHAEHLTPQNAAEIVSRYDVVLDCTDHPTSRYLVSDACVLLGKPLVSASALRTDGQLIVLNNPPAPQGVVDGGGPCYRCVFPRPPPADSVVSCGEGGILGPVVGVMGVLQALEAIKLIAAGIDTSLFQTQPDSTTSSAAAAVRPPPSLLLFTAGSGATAAAAGAVASFRSVRMRARRPDCLACSAAASSTLTLDALRSGALDYVQFCGVAAPVRILRPGERVSAAEYHRRRRSASCLRGPAADSAQSKYLQRQQQGPKQDNRLSTAAATTTDATSKGGGGGGGGGDRDGRRHVLLDVREKEHFDIASLPGAINIPFSKFQAEMRRRARDDRGGSAISAAGLRDTAAASSLLPEWLLPRAPLKPAAAAATGVTGEASEVGGDNDENGGGGDGDGTEPRSPDVYVICRLGNDSQVVARQLQELLGLPGGSGSEDSAGEDEEVGKRRFVGDIEGGMAAWKRDVEHSMPFT